MQYPLLSIGIGAHRGGRGEPLIADEPEVARHEETKHSWEPFSFLYWYSNDSDRSTITMQSLTPVTAAAVPAMTEINTKEIRDLTRIERIGAHSHIRGMRFCHVFEQHDYYCLSLFSKKLTN